MLATVTMRNESPDVPVDAQAPDKSWAQLRVEWVLQTWGMLQQELRGSALVYTALGISSLIRMQNHKFTKY